MSTLAPLENFFLSHPRFSINQGLEISIALLHFLSRTSKVSSLKNLSKFAVILQNILSHYNYNKIFNNCQYMRLPDIVSTILSHRARAFLFSIVHRIFLYLSQPVFIRQIQYSNTVNYLSPQKKRIFYHAGKISADLLKILRLPAFSLFSIDRRNFLSVSRQIFIRQIHCQFDKITWFYIKIEGNSVFRKSQQIY